MNQRGLFSPRYMWGDGNSTLWGLLMTQSINHIAPNKLRCLLHPWIFLSNYAVNKNSLKLSRIN